MQNGLTGSFACIDRTYSYFHFVIETLQNFDHSIKGKVFSIRIANASNIRKINADKGRGFAFWEILFIENTNGKCIKLILGRFDPWNYPDLYMVDLAPLFKKWALFEKTD